jgi:signal transduction histidine kinase
VAPQDVERRRVRRPWSNRTTWIGSLAVALGVGVAALTAVPQLAIREMDEDFHARIANYSAILPGQLDAAVATGDRDAARRALGALAADADVIAVTLRGSAGDEIYRAGAPGPLSGAAAPRGMVESGDRVAIVLAVPAAGRPAGQLAIELSTARLRHDRRIAVWTAIIAGAAALLFGLIARRLIARSVVERLRTLVEAETATDRDDDRPQAPDQPHDEIAIFGDAFHAMLTRLRHDQVRLRTTVSELTAVKDELACTNRELEQRVAQRTSELIDANRQLHGEMAQRAQMEVELRQAQKLESVGRLASGIAHEINTPVQFVSDSCSFLETATVDLITVIAAYRAALAELDTRALTASAACDRMRGVEAERDLGYVIEQTPLAIQRALNGLSRVSAIVHAMKEFAYADRKEQAPADLNRAILSTLTVARNEYKYVAEVTTEFDDLPPVTCHIGELNQVILNMVVNSAHAIADAKGQLDRDGRIVVRTRAADTEVAIEIEDNGCGIPAAAFDKIFDPFFTTKEIGRGTGQGLAIARTVIVDKHAGKIEVASRVGYGTTFTITLPVLGRDSVAIAPISGEPIARSDDSIDRGLPPPSGHDLESA